MSVLQLFLFTEQMLHHVIQIMLSDGVWIALNPRCKRVTGVLDRVLMNSKFCVPDFSRVILDTGRLHDSQDSH